MKHSIKWLAILSSLLVFLSAIAEACGGADSPSVSPLDASIDTSTTIPLVCNGDTQLCSNQCVDTKLDPSNCGECGRGCAPDQSCIASVCTTKCASTLTTCTVKGIGICVYTQSDNANCGACGNQCAPGTQCSKGACAASCDSSLTVCGSGAAAICSDLKDDPRNCGACGNVCPSGDVCNAGICGSFCNNNVLFIGDADATGDQKLATALSSYGLTFTMLPNGCTTYAGTPSPKGFGAIYVHPETYFGHFTMPGGGQSSIVDAWNGGGPGIVFSGAMMLGSANNTLLSTLEINSGGAFVGGQSLGRTDAGNPLWGGLPDSFVVGPNLGFCSDCNVLDGGTVLARDNMSIIPGLVIHQGASRTVELPGGWFGNVEVNEPNYIPLMANALKWAARCL